MRETASGSARKASSANALRGSLRGFFRYLVRSEVLTRDPSRLIRRAITAPAPPRGLRTVEEDNLLQVLREAQGAEAERDSMLIELMLGCGLRLSSALALDVEDLDLGEGVAHLRTVKGGTEQRVFLPKQVGQALAEFLGDRRAGPVFQSVLGRRITGRHFQRRFRSWCKKAGVSNAATCHSLRHSFAMRLYRKTGDVLLVKSALGHRSITSTLVYAHANEAGLRAALGASPGP